MCNRSLILFKTTEIPVHYKIISAIPFLMQGILRQTGAHQQNREVFDDRITNDGMARR